jgi:hypothetical protein
VITALSKSRRTECAIPNRLTPQEIDELRESARRMEEMRSILAARKKQAEAESRTVGRTSSSQSWIVPVGAEGEGGHVFEVVQAPPIVAPERLTHGRGTLAFGGVISSRRAVRMPVQSSAAPGEVTSPVQSRAPPVP